MSNFQLPKVTVLDTNGDPVSGAKLFFYLTGTSTPEDVYQDQANTTPHTNPVICDSDGRSGPIWMDNTKTYKLVVKDASDITIYTVDPIKAYDVRGDSLTIRIQQIASNPLDYGAIGDGVADESSEVQQAIDNATGTVDLLGKTYRCDSALTLDSGIRLINGTLDFTSATATELVTLTGTKASTLALTANADLSATALTMSDTSTLSAGDWLVLNSSATYASGAADGEVVRVGTVDSGTQVSAASRIQGAYTTANTAKVAKLTTKANVTIEDVRFVSSHGSEQDCIALQYC